MQTSSVSLLYFIHDTALPGLWLTQVKSEQESRLEATCRTVSHLLPFCIFFWRSKLKKNNFMLGETWRRWKTRTGQFCPWRPSHDQKVICVFAVCSVKFWKWLPVAHTLASLHLRKVQWLSSSIFHPHVHNSLFLWRGSQQIMNLCPVSVWEMFILFPGQL
jgi:hypothetical protein